MADVRSQTPGATILPLADLPIGVSMSGLVHTDQDAFDIDTRFALAREAGVFDYVERIPPPGEIDLYMRASQKHGIPLRVGIFYYVLGRDEPLLAWHIRVCRQIGATTMNIHIIEKDVDGRSVTDEQVARAYLDAWELGAMHGVTPSLEVHVGMWSEHFGRIARVADLVEAQGVRFNMTLDASHVIFKIDNPVEQAVQGLRDDIDAGLIEIDPRRPNDVITQWIERNFVHHAHARASAPANPINIWSRHPDGRPGRGIQYPFVAPGPGEWHSPWNEDELGPWKLVVTRLLRHHATNANSPLRQITTEFIPFVDYGAGAHYSMLKNNIACARWLRSTWEAIGTQAQAV